MSLKSVVAVSIISAIFGAFAGVCPDLLGKGSFQVPSFLSLRATPKTSALAPRAIPHRV